MAQRTGDRQRNREKREREREAGRQAGRQRKRERWGGGGGRNLPKYIPTLTDGFSLMSVLTDHNCDDITNIDVFIFLRFDAQRSCSIIEQ